jgi:hypothetical protein
VLSRPEGNPDAALEVKVVEEVFTRLATIWEVQVRGRVIGTTAEHPFYARGKGWTPARLLEPGDRLHGHDGEWVAVEAIRETSEVVLVYNMRVADFHTYFVGCPEWSFSAWAHNAPCEVADIQEIAPGISKDDAAIVADMINRGTATPEAIRAFLEYHDADLTDVNTVLERFGVFDEGAGITHPDPPTTRLYESAAEVEAAQTAFRLGQFDGGNINSHLTLQAIRELQGDPSGFSKFGVSDPVNAVGEPTFTVTGEQAWVFEGRIQASHRVMALGADPGSVFVIETWFDRISGHRFQVDYVRGPDGTVADGTFHLRSGPR